MPLTRWNTNVQEVCVNIADRAYGYFWYLSYSALITPFKNPGMADREGAAVINPLNREYLCMTVVAVWNM